MKFNYHLSFNFEGKNNHNFSNNEIKSHFFLFFVQKSCCVFAQFKKLLYICGKIRTCGRTQQNLLNTNCGLCTARKYLRRFIYRSPQKRLLI